MAFQNRTRQLSFGPGDLRDSFKSVVATGGSSGALIQSDPSNPPDPVAQARKGLNQILRDTRDRVAVWWSDQLNEWLPGTHDAPTQRRTTEQPTPTRSGVSGPVLLSVLGVALLLGVLSS